MAKFWQLSKSKNKKTAELTLYGDISNKAWWGDEVTPKQFKEDIEALGDVDTIIVRINSYGGDVFAGITIHNILKAHKAEIEVYIDGIAASAASLIAMAGDLIIMPANTMMMIHNPWTVAIGDSEELRETADVLDKIRESIVTSYAAKSNLSREEIIDIMKAETWLTAGEAEEHGFADIVEDKEVSMKFDAMGKNININGLKMSVKEWSKLKNKPRINNIKNKEDFRVYNERKSNMNIKQLCQKVGLDYDLLVNSGLTDDQVKAMALEVQLKQSQDVKTENPKVEPPQPENKTETEVKAETERCLTVLQLCNDFDVDSTEFIKNKTPLADVQTTILEQQKAKMKPIAENSPNVTVTSDEADKIRDTTSDAILLRSGIRLETPAEGANSMRVMSLRDIAIDCLVRQGVNNAHRLSHEDIFRMSLTPDSQFSSILSTSVNKSLRAAYEEANATFKIWTGTDSNPDFKSKPFYRLSEAGDLSKVYQGGEIKFDQMQDESVTTQLDTYAKMWGFTRQAMINDDLGVLTKIPIAYVRSAIRKTNQLVYALLCTTSPAMTQYDSADLFSSGRGNLAGSGGAIAKATLTAARAAMAKQKQQRSKAYLNTKPAFLIVPPDQEDDAAILLKSMADPSASGNSGVHNIHKDSMELVVDAELSGYSTTAWYCAADPRDIDTIIVTYLNGQEMPTLETQQGFDYLGVKWRIYYDVAATVGDYKGLYKNAGA